MPRKNSDSFWFKFYPDKYLGGTIGFTLEMHGAYLMLLLKQWNSGPIKEEDAIATIGDLWNKIKHKFLYTESGYVNVRMDIEKNHKAKISEKRISAVLSRYNKYKNQNVKTGYNCTSNVVQTSLLYSSSNSSSSKDKKKDKKKDIYNNLFLNFWELYPKKTGKGAAWKKWKRIKEPSVVIEKIKEALMWQKQLYQWTKNGGEYIPYQATYLNEKRWEDEKEEEWHLT